MLYFEFRIVSLTDLYNIFVYVVMDFVNVYLAVSDFAVRNCFVR